MSLSYEPASEPHDLERMSVKGSGLGNEQLLRTDVKRFRGGLVLKAHRPLFHSTLGLRVIKKKKRISISGFRVSTLGLNA